MCGQRSGSDVRASRPPLSKQAFGSEESQATSSALIRCCWIGHVRSTCPSNSTRARHSTWRRCAATPTWRSSSCTAVQAPTWGTTPGSRRCTPHARRTTPPSSTTSWPPARMLTAATLPGRRRFIGPLMPGLSTLSLRCWTTAQIGGRRTRAGSSRFTRLRPWEGHGQSPCCCSGTRPWSASRRTAVGRRCTWRRMVVTSLLAKRWSPVVQMSQPRIGSACSHCTGQPCPVASLLARCLSVQPQTLRLSMPLAARPCMLLVKRGGWQLRVLCSRPVRRCLPWTT
mmetsp:Transcript_92238/g.266216  ORF Transcript_92238/g.266216 Transcript_92238/m.266216 type:complete len:284 (+) Transcript_92238:185-1036(+)